jgi:hypothetical protein
MGFMNQAIAFRFINDKFRWLECYDFKNDKIYFLSLNSDDNIKLKNSIIKSIDVNKYLEKSNMTKDLIPISEQQKDEILEIDSHGLIQTNRKQFMKKYKLEHWFI